MSVIDRVVVWAVRLARALMAPLMPRRARVASGGGRVPLWRAELDQRVEQRRLVVRLLGVEADTRARVRRAARVTPVLFRHAYPRATSNGAHYLGLGKQSNKGTGVTPTVFAAYQGAVDLDQGMTADPIREAGLGPYVSRHMKTAHDPSGGCGLAWRPATLARISAWFLGTDTVTGASVPYTHTATPDEALRVWLTAEQAAGVDGDIIERYVDALIKSLTISCEGNGDLMAAFQWFALTPEWRSTASVPTYETGVSGVSAGGPYRGAEASYTVDGVSGANVQSFEVALEWSYDEDIRNASVTRSDALKLELTGTVKVKQLIAATADVEQYRKVNYGSAAGTAANKNLSTGNFTAVFDNGLSSTNARTVTITVPRITWEKSTYSALNPDGETMYLELEGTINKVAASAFVSIASQTADSGAY